MDSQDNKNVYLISLDAFDVNFLPSSVKRTYKDTMPLWTKNYSDLQNKICEFEIREVKEDNTKMENLTCHLCDIEIPKAYYNEHKTSFRHRFNNKITEISLQRAQKHIKHDQHIDMDTDTTDHYCQQCCVVVEGNNESVHKQTVMHKNSLALERLLKDFLHIYANEDVPDGNSVIKNDKIATEKKVLTNVTVDEKHSITRSKKANDIVNFISETANSRTSTGEDNEEISTKDYISLINTKFDMKLDLEAFNDDFLIKTEDGSVVRVERNKFHGLLLYGGYDCICMICNVSFKTVALNKHIMSDSHIMLASLPLFDRNCIQPIKDSSHCLICNALVFKHDIDHHIHRPSHERKLLERLITDGRTKEIIKKDVPLYTDVVNRNKIVNSTDSVVKMKKQRHRNTATHIQNTKSDYDYMLSSTDGQNTCLICDNTVSEDSQAIVDHFESLTHKNIYKDCLAKNYITKIDNDFLYCAKCDTNILCKNELLHIKTHVLKSKESDTENNKLYIKVKMPNPYHFCKICQVNVPNNVNNIQMHEKGKLHLRNLDKQNEKVENKSVENDKTVNGSIENEKLENVKLAEKVENEKIINKSVENEKIKTENYYQVEVKSNVATCKVCELDLVNDEHEITAHLQSEGHSVRYDDFVAINHLVIIDNDIHCSVCAVNCGVRSELIHCSGKNHKNNLKLKKVSDSGET